MLHRCGQVLLAPLLLGVICAGGCNTVPAAEFQAVQRDLQLSQERVQRLEQQVADQQTTIRSQQEQVARLRGIEKTAGVDDLVVPVRIELERMSGGYDNDGKTGDDGIVLYIQPFDRDGSVIKAAGTLDIKLLDLANPPDRMLIATYHFDPPTTRGMWYGRMWTHHFSARCPFPPNRLPEHPEVTAQVTFTDLLTGAALSTQGVFKITLPPKLNAGN